MGCRRRGALEAAEGRLSRWALLPRSGRAGAAAQPRPPRLLLPPGERELGADPGARGEEEKGEVRLGARGGQGRDSIASPEPAAGCHLQPLKEAPPEKMPCVASCRCSQEPERHLADWGASGAYVFISLTLQCPQRRGRLQGPGGGKRGALPNPQSFTTFDPHALQPSMSPVLCRTPLLASTSLPLPGTKSFPPAGGPWGED